MSALFYYAMRETSSRFHSRVEKVLRILMDNSIVGIDDKPIQGSDSVVEVIITVFQRNVRRTVRPKQFLYDLQ